MGGNDTMSLYEQSSQNGSSVAGGNWTFGAMVSYGMLNRESHKQQKAYNAAEK